MNKWIGGLVLIFALAVSAVSLYAQQSLAGKWIMSVHGMSLRLVMTQDGEKISGTLESPHGEISLTGEFSKGKLTLVGASVDSQPIQFAGTANLREDGSLAGVISANQMEMSFTAVRATSEQ
jgi:hypothetical protein